MSIKRPKDKNLVINTWSGFDNSVGVYYETPEGKRETKIIDFDWYFLIKTSDLETSLQFLKNTTFLFRTETDHFEEYTRIYTKEIWNERVLIQSRFAPVLLLEKNGIQTFEGDLMPDRKWYINREIQIAEKYSKLYFDIETDDSRERLEIGYDRILSFAGITDKGKEIYFRLDDFSDLSEQKLLKKIVSTLEKFDIILGWNSGEFDLPYIKDRLKKYELKSNFRKKNAHIDLLKRFRHIFRFDSNIKQFNLDHIGKHFLGHGKVEHKEKIIDLYRTQPDGLLKEYNLEDARLLKQLDDKLNVSDMIIRQSSWCGVPVSQFGLYSIIDAYILKTAHHNKRYGKTSLTAIKERSTKHIRGNVNPDETNTKKSKYIGAAVLDPKIGKYDRVYSFDFKSLYPSLIRTSNIGYDSLRNVDDDVCIINPGTSHIPRTDKNIKPTFFDKTPSVINLTVTELLTKRTEYKNKKLEMIENGTNKGPEWERVVSDEIIVKELSNSTYGIMGLEYGRYYSVDVAESITLFGQWILNNAKEYFESIGQIVIYGDTDSIFVATATNTNLDIEKTLEDYHIHLKLLLKEKYRIDDCFITLNFDKLYKSFILIAKKTYVGNVINIEGKKTNDVYARGLDYIKKNTFSYAAIKQRELIDSILFEDLDVSKIKEWMIQIKKEFYEKEFTKQELILVQRVGRNTTDYKKNPPLHVRLAQKLKEKNGENMIRKEIEYIVTGMNPIMQGVLTSDFVGRYDKEYYWENKTQPILERITDVVFPGSDFFNRQVSLF